MIHKEYLVLFQSNIKLNLTVNICSVFWYIKTRNLLLKIFIFHPIINNKLTINFKFA